MLISLHLLASASRYSPMAEALCSGLKRSGWLRLLRGPLNATFAASSAGCFTPKPVPSLAWALGCRSDPAHCKAQSWLLHGLPVLSLTWAACLQVWPQLAVCTV